MSWKFLLIVYVDLLGCYIAVNMLTKCHKKVHSLKQFWQCVSFFSARFTDTYCSYGGECHAGSDVVKTGSLFNGYLQRTDCMSVTNHCVCINCTSLACMYRKLKYKYNHRTTVFSKLYSCHGNYFLLNYRLPLQQNRQIFIFNLLGAWPDTWL